MALNVVCLLWKGNFRKRNYRDEDVNRLHEMVRKNYKEDFRFFCLTNDMDADVDAEKVALHHNWPGWWSKIENFRPDLPYKGLVLYMDLDITIIDDLKPLVTHGDTSQFTMSRGKHKERIGDLELGISRKYQASVMRHVVGSDLTNEMYARFCEDPPLWMSSFRSEQDLYGRWYPNLPIFPDEVLIKLGTARKVAKRPEGAIIVTGNKDGGGFRNPNIDWMQ